MPPKESVWGWILFHVWDDCICSQCGVKGVGQSVTTVLSGRHPPIRKLYRAPSHKPPILLPHHLFYHDHDCFIYCRFIKLYLCYLCGYLCCCELQTCFVVYLTWRHVKSIFVCFRLHIPFVYFGISADDVLLDFQNRWLRWECTRTLCTVFSALNKICCILLWTLYILLFLRFCQLPSLNIKKYEGLFSQIHIFYFLINTYAPFL